MTVIPQTPLTRWQVMRLAVPVMLAQVAIAATGVVDTAIMGLTGDKSDLAAVAVASAAFGFIYWGFGFLRMSTTGLTAQAVGRGDENESRAVLQRGLIVGLAIGLVIFALGPVLKPLVFQPFGTEAEVESLAKEYFAARIWGAPALLMSYAITGWLLGTGRTRAMLAMQIVLNLVNVVLTLWFVIGLEWGIAGLGLGTAIAEWVALLFGLFIVRYALKPEARLSDRDALIAMFSANRDVLIRTLALLFAFAWFIRSGAMMGTAQLAGNEVLLQFVTVSAFVLDGFAFVAEKEVGEAFGANDQRRLRRAMRVTSELALAFGAVISLVYITGGASIIEIVVKDDEARVAALAYLPFCALVPLIGVPAWQLDGFFLGATRGRAVRSAGILFCVAYVGLDLILRPPFGNTGVWAAFLFMYVFRALALAIYLPDLLSPKDQPPQPQPQR